jgi:hypothetical protein
MTDLDIAVKQAIKDCIEAGLQPLTCRLHSKTIQRAFDNLDRRKAEYHEDHNDCPSRPTYR